MRHVVYTKNDLVRSRGRVVSVRENIADADSDTCVVKNFVYLVRRVDACPPVESLPSPQIRIHKKVDTQHPAEGFFFKVKGVVYIKKNRFIFQIRYSHSLRIRILWKTHVLSSDNPAALT
jgi:hypothetical protein